MLIRHIEIHSDLSKKLIYERLRSISRNKCVKTDKNKFSFRMHGQISLLKYTPTLRVSGTIKESEKCIIQIRIFPYLWFWIVFSLALISAIVMLCEFLYERRLLAAPILILLLFFVLLIADLLGQLEICQSKIKRALGND